MTEAPPPYSTEPQAASFPATTANNRYTKGPSKSFLATHPSANSIQQQKPVNPAYIKGPSDSYLASHPSAGNTLQQKPLNPAYIKGPSDSYLASHPLANNTPRQASPTMSNGSSKTLFPESFGFYHASGTHSDMMIALSADSPPIFHVSTHGGFSSQPSVVLHSGAYESAAPIATADFHSFSSSVDVMLFSQHFALEREGAFSTVTFFNYPIPQANGQVQLERFEWKSSSGPEVQSLRGSSHGMKCVRVRTGEVVAAWARANSGTRKKGKMAFMMRDRGLGDEKFETMVVISVLSIMEKARRRKNASRGAAAGGAAGGGAGC